MKNRISLLGIIAVVAIIGLGFTACGGDDDGTGGTHTHSYDWVTSPGAIISKKCICGEIDGVPITLTIGDTGLAGGKIIYVNPLGFTVTGLGTCYYLEAALTNQAENVRWSSTNLDVTGATGTAIGTGKANTAAIVAAHSGDTESNNAAKAIVAYDGGGKNDWFLPSKDELNEMYKARTHLGISSGWFWSSSQRNKDTAWEQSFTTSGGQGNDDKSNYIFYNYKNVRAIRAF